MSTALSSPVPSNPVTPSALPPSASSSFFSGGAHESLSTLTKEQEAEVVRKKAELENPTSGKSFQQVGRNEEGEEEQVEKTYYLAYGAALHPSQLKTRLGATYKPVSAQTVQIPSAYLSFDFKGVPFLEPCFTNAIVRGVNDLGWREEVSGNNSLETADFKLGSRIDSKTTDQVEGRDEDEDELLLPYSSETEDLSEQDSSWTKIRSPPSPPAPQSMITSERLNRGLLLQKPAAPQIKRGRATLKSNRTYISNEKNDQWEASLAYKKWVWERCCPGIEFTGDFPPVLEGVAFELSPEHWQDFLSRSSSNSRSRSRSTTRPEATLQPGPLPRTPSLTKLSSVPPADPTTGHLRNRKNAVKESSKLRDSIVVPPSESTDGTSSATSLSSNLTRFAKYLYTSLTFGNTLSIQSTTSSSTTKPGEESASSSSSSILYEENEKFIDDDEVVNTGPYELVQVNCTVFAKGDPSTPTGNLKAWIPVVVSEEDRKAGLQPTQKYLRKVLLASFMSTLSQPYLGHLILLRPFTVSTWAQRFWSTFVTLLYIPPFLFVHLPLNYWRSRNWSFRRALGFTKEEKL